MMQLEKESEARAKARLIRRREILLDQRNHLTEEISGLQAEPPREGAPVRSAAALLASLDEQERLELTRIETALERLRDGSYGRCVDCGGAIGRARLQALPEALVCIGCADSHEG